MNIITISREFGSGGRELGKRLADLTGYDYYDSEIIAAVAKNSGLAPDYVESTLSDHGWQNLSLTYRRTLSSASYVQSSQIGMIVCECWLFTFLLIPDMIIIKERERVTAFDCINLYFWR